MGLTQVSVAGDTRFDTVVATALAPPRPLPLVEAFVADGAPVLVVGSSWPEDLPVLRPLLAALRRPAAGAGGPARSNAKPTCGRLKPRCPARCCATRRPTPPR